ncbi:MAG: Uma2 family endonuclease [Verrucomicrobiales bacterium]|nr:Uma2 family endonuclease [Verrucomicrobiales bacterium]
MTPLETLIEPLRHSPQLVEVVDLLSKQIADERSQRRQFYQDLTPEQKAEFIDGEVILHSPARNCHLDATSRLSRLLSIFVDLHQLGTVKAEKCLCVFPRNDYEPDIVFFSNARSAELEPGTMKFPVPDLVVEVLSPSTEANDRGVKFEDYAAHGVREYWIVDPEAETVEQYLPGDEGGAYELRVKSATGTLSAEAIPGLTLPIRALFDDAENLAALKAWM